MSTFFFEMLARINLKTSQGTDRGCFYEAQNVTIMAVSCDTSAVYLLGTF